MYNLFMTSKNETKNSPIHEYKVLQARPESLLIPLFNGVFFLIYHFKKHFKPCLSIFKALKDILQHFNSHLSNKRGGGAKNGKLKNMDIGILQ